ncbi:hypothetical protein FRB99_005665 [Tulasnella sp. 403]|nr:hypothetical protein FRB99_005665 [Tulasnella sp. 403]
MGVKPDSIPDTMRSFADPISSKKSASGPLVTGRLAKLIHRPEANGFGRMVAGRFDGALVGASNTNVLLRDTVRLLARAPQNQEALEVKIHPTTDPPQPTQPPPSETEPLAPDHYTLIHFLALSMRVIGVTFAVAAVIHVYAFAIPHVSRTLLRLLCTRGPKSKSDWNGQNEHLPSDRGRDYRLGWTLGRGEPHSNRDPTQQPLRPKFGLERILATEPVYNQLKEDLPAVAFYQGGLFSQTTRLLERPAELLVYMQPAVAPDTPPPLEVWHRPLQDNLRVQAPARPLSSHAPPLSSSLPRQGNQRTNSENPRSIPRMSDEPRLSQRGSALPGPRNDSPESSTKAMRRTRRNVQPYAKESNSDRYPKCSCHEPGWLNKLAPSKAARHWKEACPSNPDKTDFSCDVNGCGFKTKQKRNLDRHRLLKHEGTDHPPPPNQEMEE